MAAVGTALTLTLAVAPSAAAASNYIATPNGMTGVSQTITINAPAQKGKQISIKVVDGAKHSATFHTTVNSKGFGSLTWTPQSSGPATLSGVGSIASITPTTVSVAGSPSYLELRAPDVVQAGTASSAVVDVYVPMGNPYGDGNAQLATIGVGPGSEILLGSAPMQSATTSRPTATVPFTMSQTALGLWAQFQGTTSTPSGAFPSGSISAVVNASADPVPVAIRSLIAGDDPVFEENGGTTGGVGGMFPLNVATAIDAVLGPGYPDGTVVWSLDGTPIAGPMPTSGGVAAWAWTPTTTGQHVLTATYNAIAADGVTPISATDSVSFVVQDWQVKDGITLTPTGQSAWKPGGTVKMKNGTSLTLTGKSTSGTTVLLSETGPCVIKGSVLMAVNTGTCKVTAVSPGTLKYTPGQAVYTVTVTS